MYVTSANASAEGTRNSRDGVKVYLRTLEGSKGQQILEAQGQIVDRISQGKNKRTNLEAATCYQIALQVSAVMAPCAPEARVIFLFAFGLVSLDH